MKKRCSFVFVLIVLHISLLIYSSVYVFSKKLVIMNSFSLEWYLHSLKILLAMGVYATVWQQIIKKLPLTVAYSNKAVVVVWGMIWGVLFFGEAITAGKLAGAALVILGTILYTYSDLRNDPSE